MNVFSEVGFNGARVDEIARQAGVNKATLYYQIGDKKALYTAILHNVLGHAAERITAELAARPMSPDEKMRAYVRGFAQAVERSPQMAPIMMRELASGGKNFPGEVVADFARIIGIVTNILEEGFSKGVFIKVTPFIIHMMVAGAIVLYRATGPIRAGQPGIPAAIRELDLGLSDRVAEEIEQLILNAVMKKTSR